MTSNEEQREYWADEGESWVGLEDQYNAMLRPFGELVVERLTLQPGERVLDIGCGTGDTTLGLGEVVGPTGVALGVDISTSMLGRATERSAGIANVNFVEADAQSFDFEDMIVDAVASRFGVMFFEDPGAAFANLVSPLRPGGRAVFLTWQGIEKNEWMLVPGGALMSVGIELPLGGDPREPGPFQLADAEWAESLLTDAGLIDVVAEPIDTTMLIGGGLDAEGSVAFLRDSGIGRSMLADVDDELAARALDAAVEATRPFETDEGVRMGAGMQLLSGRKPD
ncbi:MAG: class I SAM-dependent methyltransferase [Ilumatobacteraceae bacterium]